MNIRFYVRCGTSRIAGRRRTVIAAVAAAMLLVIPPPVVGQDAGLERLDRVLPADAAARIRAIAMEAREQGVPPGLVINKALEGSAKGVAPQRIVPAVEQYAARLRQARSILGPDRRPAELMVVAEAVRRGVPESHIRDLARAGGEVAIPLLAVGELSAAGIPTDQAFRMVQRALDGGQGGDRLLAFSRAVKRQVHNGMTPDRAVEFVRQRVRAQPRRTPTDRAASDRTRDRPSRPAQPHPTRGGN